MHTTFIKSFNLQDKMSVLNLKVEHHCKHKPVIILDVSVKLEHQVYTARTSASNPLEKPDYISGAFRDGKFTDKALWNIGKKVETAIEQATGVPSPDVSEAIVTQMKNCWQSS